MTKNKIWLISFISVCLAVGIGVASVTAYIDLYMHYHAPLTDKYYYNLYNERSQNDGITKHFDYDGIITGTSMTENFKASEAGRIFDANFIKVPYSGATFKELNDNLKVGFKKHPNTKYVIRSLDRYLFEWDKDSMRDDMGIDFPYYLYDNNPFNDVQYLFNRDVFFTTAYDMIKARSEGREAGITSFDDYANWMGDGYIFGADSVLHTVFKDDKSHETGFYKSDRQEAFTDDEKQTVYDNVIQNVTDLADKYPQTQFYYFLPPYSAVYWGERIMDGSFDRQIALEKYAAGLIVSHKNIHLFMWNSFDIQDDLNNYKDDIHYSDRVNTLILSKMKKGEGRLTEDNYEDIINEEAAHYRAFDYNRLFNQN